MERVKGIEPSLSAWDADNEGGQKRPSDISSDFVTHGSALLSIVAASAKCEALSLEACRDTSLNGVLGVECSNHSVPTIFFNDLAQLSRVGLFHAQGLLRGIIPFSSSRLSVLALASQSMKLYSPRRSVAQALR